MVAVVTNDHPFRAMVGEGDITVGTLNRFAAGATENKTRVTPAVQEDDRLFTLLMSCLNCLEQLVRENLWILVQSKCFPNINDPSGSHRSIADARG